MPPPKGHLREKKQRGQQKEIWRWSKDQRSYNQSNKPQVAEFHLTKVEIDPYYDSREKQSFTQNHKYIFTSSLVDRGNRAFYMALQLNKV